MFSLFGRLRSRPGDEEPRKSCIETQYLFAICILLVCVNRSVLRTVTKSRIVRDYIVTANLLTYA